MRGVLIVIFWAWLAVSVAVYGYRLFRRVTQGPKAVRDARAATDEGRSVALGADPDAAGEPVAGSPPRAPADRPEAAPQGAPQGAPPPERRSAPIVNSPVGPSTAYARTVAEALRGIDLPCDLVPIVDVENPATATGRCVVFTTRSSDVRTVASSLAHELENLGYQASDAPTDPSGERRRLIATRADATVTIAVTLDDSGAVAAEVST